MGVPPSTPDGYEGGVPKVELQETTQTTNKPLPMHGI